MKLSTREITMEVTKTLPKVYRTFLGGQYEIIVGIKMFKSQIRL